MDIWSLLAHGTVTLLIGGGIFAAVRSAVSKAVDVARERTLTALNAANAKSLADHQAAYSKALADDRMKWEGIIEERRQEFSRMIDKEREDGQRRLEVFKATLGFGAEVRRQVAAKKVEALLKILEASEPLLRLALNARVNRPEDRAAFFSGANSYVIVVREREFFFTEDVATSLKSFVGRIAQAHSDWLDKNDPEALDRAMASLNNLLQLARKELFIETEAAGT